MTDISKIVLLLLVTLSVVGCELVITPGSPLQSVKARSGLKSYRITMTTMKAAMNTPRRRAASRTD